MAELADVITRHWLAATDEGGIDLLTDEPAERVLEVGYRLGFANALQVVAGMMVDKDTQLPDLLTAAATLEDGWLPEVEP
ncbi:hypothetical protein BH23CHL8_BH23CHL8_26330 [soil metagenome]